MVLKRNYGGQMVESPVGMVDMRVVQKAAAKGSFVFVRGGNLYRER